MSLNLSIGLCFDKRKYKIYDLWFKIQSSVIWVLKSGEFYYKDEFNREIKVYIL